MSVDEPEQIIVGETGLQQSLGYVNHIYADRTETTIEFDERHGNRHGGLHGGVYSMLLDSSCGFAASRSLSDKADQLVVTLTLTTNYLAPVRAGTVRAISRATGGGKSVVYASGEVFDDDGNLVATGSGVFKAIRKRS